MIPSRRTVAVAIAVFVITSILIFNRDELYYPSSYQVNQSELSKLCHAHHSVLYKDVESTEAYWRRVGGMTRDDLEASRYICMRDGNCPILKIYNGVLYIRLPLTPQLGFQSRAHAQLLMLSRLDYTDQPNADFLINPNDGVRVMEPCFLEMDKHISEARSKSRKQAINHFLLPDFTTFDWPESRLPAFQETRLSMAEKSGPFETKDPRMVWRGTTDLQQGTQRTDLVNQLSPQTDIADIAVTDIKDFHIKPGTPGNLESVFKTLPELCRYQYIIYTEGVTYSGRLKYSALCNSVQIGHRITFIEFWTHLLDPYYVTVKNWDDAVAKRSQLFKNPQKAARLARGPVDVIRDHLSPFGVSCYIKRMLEGYARSQRWQVLSPEQDIYGKNGSNTTIDSWTWLPLDRFLTKTTWLGTWLSTDEARNPFNTTQIQYVPS